MEGINQEQFPGFIDISNYSAFYKVFAKQLERNEQVLIEIKDALIEHNKLHTDIPKIKKHKKSKKKV